VPTRHIAKHDPLFFYRSDIPNGILFVPICVHFNRILIQFNCNFDFDFNSISILFEFRSNFIP
ncbi:hypothetical protein, partial [Flavobacterium nitrogenifigens]|uniref:hypothetical protein n=1 Tax=Flavobacterium nitrogenifigens TaxID=1617283 RepID=UPI001C8F9823